MSQNTLVSVETPGDTHTFIHMGVAVFKPVSTLVHGSFMFKLRDYAMSVGVSGFATRIAH
jgi:hypothetical protein